MMTAAQIAEAVRRGDTTAEAACEAALERLTASERDLHAFIQVDADGARSDLAAHRAARREAAENQGAPSGGRS